MKSGNRKEKLKNKIVLLVCLLSLVFVGGGCASITVSRADSKKVCGVEVTKKTTGRFTIGPEINVWTGSGSHPVYYAHGPVSYPGQFGRGPWYGSDVHPNGSPFVPAIILSEPPPMPPNVGWWVNQPMITGPSSTEMELHFQRETKFQYFGDPGHSGHRRHGLQPPVGPPNSPPPVAPNPPRPQNNQGGNGGSGRPHGLQPQK